MSEHCNHDCSACQESCAEREKTDFLEKANPDSRIRRVIGVASGKGGVGKSLVTATLAVLLRRRGLNVAVLDADITGPSIPRAFGVATQALGTEKGLLPVESETGVKLMSLNLLLEDATAPVVWRGPVIAGTVKQFWTDVLWGDIDVMLIDMPPGTGDVPLTVFQSIPMDGVVIVTSPQSLVAMIVEKAVNMAELMRIPVLGLVENMSYLACPDCGRVLRPFGESHLDAVAARHGILHTAALPLDGRLAALSDNGRIEDVAITDLDATADMIEALPARVRD